jgi:hypothetical protein
MWYVQKPLDRSYLECRRGGTKGSRYSARFSWDVCFLFSEIRTKPVMGAKNHPRKNHSQALRFVV